MLWSPFTIIHVQKSEERGKSRWGNPPSRNDKAQNLNNMSSIGLYLHLNELDELLLVKDLMKKFEDSMIMRWSVESARRKRRDSLYIII